MERKAIAIEEFNINAVNNEKSYKENQIIE